MNPFQLIDTLRGELKLRVDQTLAAAAKAIPDQEDEWDAYMRAQEVVPKSSDERIQLLALKEERSKGALPIEVRLVLEKHKLAVIQKLSEIKTEYGSKEWWSRVEAPADKVINEFIDESIKRYIGEMNRTSVSSRNIFANAMKTTPKYFTQVHKAGTKSEKCPTCMAARPEGSDLKTCAFCGSVIFNT